MTDPKLTPFQLETEKRLMAAVEKLGVVVSRHVRDDEEPEVVLTVEGTKLKLTLRSDSAELSGTPQPRVGELQVEHSDFDDAESATDRIVGDLVSELTRLRRG
jgi:hypothetical protein